MMPPFARDAHFARLGTLTQVELALTSPWQGLRATELTFGLWALGFGHRGLETIAPEIVVGLG